jgi:hypothetical protein
MTTDEEEVEPPLFVIFKNPSDFPGKFVVRRWQGGVPEQEPLAVTSDLATARKVIPADCICVGRELDDDPCVLESWV